MFVLDDQLHRDTFPLGRLLLSDILLMDNGHYPWLILVPRHGGAKDLSDLPLSRRILLMEEISAISDVMHGAFSPYKLNIGMLGNVVSQLHVHIVARTLGDVAWPDPVWGQAKPRRPYTLSEREHLVEILSPHLVALEHFVPATESVPELTEEPV